MVAFDNKTETEKKIEWFFFLWSSLFQAKGYVIDLLTLFSEYELVDLYDDKASTAREKQKATIFMPYI